MSNPIKTTDIYQDTGELEKLINELEEARVKYEALRKSAVSDAVKLEASVKKLNGTTADHREQIERNAKAADEISRRYRKFNESLDDNAVKLAALKNAQRDLNRVNRLTAKLNASAEGSYNRLSAQYSLIKLRLNQMSTAQREGTKAGRELEKQSKAIFEEMKRLQEATGKTALNVGNYKDAIKDALGPGGSFLEQIKGFISNPIAGVFAAGAGAIALVGKAFTRTERGAKLMKRAQATLNSVWDEASRIVLDLSDSATKMWDDPKAALTDYGESFVTSFSNRVRGSIDLVTAAGQRLRAAFQDDAAAAEGAAERMTNAFATVLDGLSEVERAQNAAAAAERQRRIAEDRALADRQLAIDRANRDLTRQSEDLATAEELAQQRADDTTLSLKAQISAVDDLTAAGEARRQVELRIARNNLQLLQQQIAIREERGLDNDINTDLRQRELSLIQQVKQAERDLLVFRQDAGQRNRETRRDLFERQLDFAIDLYDAEKTVLERQASDREADIRDRAQILGRLIELNESAFNEQIQLVETFTGERVRLNELALIDDERIVRERLRQLDIDDVAMGRILEVLRERKLATQDIVELERELTAARTPQAVSVGFGFDRSGANAAQSQLSEVQRIVGNITSSPESGNQPQNIYDLLGLNLDSAEQQAISDATTFAIGQVQALAQAKTEAASQAVQASDREVQAAQANLQATIALAEQGYAVNVQAAQQELSLAEQQQREAIRLQREAQREQQLIETLQQASSLVTAAAKIFATIPFPGSLAAVGTMFGSFALAKIRAAKLTREFGEGDYTVLQGPRHTGPGTGVPLGIASDGVTEYAEGGEGRAIFTRLAVRKYGTQIADVVRQFNSLQFGEGSMAMGRSALQAVVVNSGINTGKMEDYLHQISRNSQAQTYTDSKGRTVIKRNNITTVYN